MIYSVFFQCDRCHVECRVDSESQDDTAQFIIRHCAGSEDISVLGKVTQFQERRGGLWVDVQLRIDAA